MRLSDIPVLILCGGLGTRLSSVLPNRPKGLAEVNGQPFLDFLLAQLREQGVSRFLLLTGHLSDQIEAHYNAIPDVSFSKELEPLGTGGAVKNAEALIDTEWFWVFNGDSHVSLDLRQMLQFHQQKESWMTIALSPTEAPQDYGLVALDQDSQILSFSEKPKEPAIGLINAGVYLMSKQALQEMPEGKFSIETLFFPQAIAQHRCFGYLSEGEVCDIGTPDRLKAAQTLLPTEKPSNH